VTGLLLGCKDLKISAQASAGTLPGCAIKLFADRSSQQSIC